ncbi:MAG: hypothetical protein AAF791_11855, partial [Bacteroidota bacterium]
RLCVAVETDADCGARLRIPDDEASPLRGQCLVWTSTNGTQHAETEAIVNALLSGDDPTDGGDEAAPPDLPADLTAACEDSVDNDGDGATDWPEDDGCASPRDDQEETEAGETDLMPPVRPDLDTTLAESNRAYCERVGATEDIGRLHRIARYVADRNGMEVGLDLSAADLSRKSYSHTVQHPPDQEWNGILDFSNGWTERMGLSVTVQCNASGATDLRSLLPPSIRTGTADARVRLASPEMVIWESGKVESAAIDLHFGGIGGYQNATVRYFTPGLRYIVTVEASSSARGAAFRMQTPEGWRRVGTPVAIPVQTVPPALVLARRGAGMTGT